MAAPMNVVFRNFCVFKREILHKTFNNFAKSSNNRQIVQPSCQRNLGTLAFSDSTSAWILPHHNVRVQLLQPQTLSRNGRIFFSSSASHQSDHDNDSSRRPPERPLHLMKFRELIWPHPIKTLRNWFLSFLIRGYMDQHFAPKVFLEGAEQAITAVSNLISSGKFEELDGLVTRDAIHEIRQSYRSLSARQRQLLAVNPKDIYFKFVYEIGMIFDDDSDKRFVEITTVFQGFKGVGLARERGEAPSMDEMDKTSENMYICNYRFIREYTKDIQDNTDWTINKLNHFCPRDVVKNSDIFSR